MSDTGRNSPTFKSAVGGTYFLHRRVLVWIVPGALITSVLTRDPASVRDVAAWVMVNIASLFATWLVVELLRVWLSPTTRQRPIPLWLVVASGALIGGTKGVTTSLFGWSAGLLDQLLPLAEWWRAVGTTFQGAFLLPAVTLAAATIASYRSDYLRLVSAYATRLPANIKHPDTKEQAQAAQVAGFLSEAREKIGAEHGQAITRVIDELIDRRLRPLTRTLWGTDTAHTNFTVRSLLSASVYANPFATFAVALGYAISGFSLRAQDIPLDINLLRTGMSVLAITVIMTAAKRLRPATRRWAAAHFVATMAVLTGVHVLVVERLSDSPAELSVVALTVTLAIWFPILTLLSGAVVITLRGAERLNDLFSHLIATGDTSSVDGALTRLKNRELANQLHSTVQNRLVNAARRIEASGFSPQVIRDEKQALDRLLDEATRTADDDTARANRPNFRAGLDTLFSRWDGFVTLTHTIDDTIDDLSDTDQTTVLHVVTEAINNAVRHGQAKHVALSVNVTHSTVTVTLDDDGFGPIDKPAGLGTALFNSVSDGTFSLKQRDTGGSRLTVAIRTDLSTGAAKRP